MISYEKEKNEYFKGLKIKEGLYLSNVNDYYEGLKKAFDDAFNQYARRKGESYANSKDELIKEVLETLFNFLNDEKLSFEDCFKTSCGHALKIFNNNQFGLAQKFVNMAFKNLSCYADYDKYKEKFNNCHMPLDRFTLKWVRCLGDKEINQRLAKINFAWSKIDEKLYWDIQALIAERLATGFSYKINYGKESDSVFLTLPTNSLESEFIVWHQEQINELRTMVLRYKKDDLERAGISVVE